MKIIILALCILGQPAFAQTCPDGETWVKSHHRKAYQRADGTAVAAADVVGHCRRRSPAYDYWIDFFSNKRDQKWPSNREKLRAWKREDIERVAKAMEKVPEFLWKPVILNRSGRSQIPGNPASSIQGTIVLYDKAFEQPDLLARYLVHELAHQRYYGMPDIDLVAFNLIAGWSDARSASGKSSLRKRSKSVTSDSDVGPDEDFANNLEYFLFEPERLKLKSPVLFDWYQVEFGDKIKNKKEVLK